MLEPDLIQGAGDAVTMTSKEGREEAALFGFTIQKLQPLDEFQA